MSALFCIDDLFFIAAGACQSNSANEQLVVIGSERGCTVFSQEKFSSCPLLCGGQCSNGIGKYSVIGVGGKSVVACYYRLFVVGVRFAEPVL